MGNKQLTKFPKVVVFVYFKSVSLCQKQIVYCPFYYLLFFFKFADLLIQSHQIQNKT